MTRLALAACVLCLLAPEAAADDAPRVGVVVSLRVNVEADAATELAGQLGDALRSKLQVVVIAGADADGKLPKDLPESCVAEPDCIADVAARLGADQLLFVAVIDVTGKIQLDSTWVDVARGKTESRPMLEIDPGNPKPALEAAAGQLLPDAAPRREPEPEPDNTPPDPTPTPPPVSVETTPRHMTTPTWVALGVAGAGIIAGTTFSLMAYSEFSDLERTCPESCDKGPLTLRNRLADASFGVAIVSAGVATFLYLRSGGEEKRVSPVSITGGTSSIGVSLSGAF